MIRDEPDWRCDRCGCEFYEEEIKHAEECPWCGYMYCLIWVGPF